jgi:peptidoglycan/LPS O-acetylase OafA/YrhL
MLASAVSEQKTSKLDFLEGFRGLACAYVVLYHFWYEISIAYSSVLPSGVKSFFRFLNFGNCSVAVFIAISGYCLMLSTVRSSSDSLKNGWKVFLIRRCRRILPGYYVCFLLGWLMMANFDFLQRSLLFQNAVPKYVFAGNIAHLFLVHNMNKNWVFNINPPLWSVAVEWQIYFMYAFVMMPLYKKFKSTALLISGLVLSVCLFGVSRIPVLSHNEFFWPHSWFVFIFAMAAYGAWYNYRVASNGMDKFSTSVLVASVVLCMVTLVILHICFNDKWLENHNYIAEILSGFIATGVMVFCINSVLMSRKSRLAAFLSLQPVVFLGKISYSIYLYHCFVMAIVIFLAMKYLGGGLLSLFVTLFTSLSLVVAISFFFYKYIERPFMRS